jgi:hypothetical protein
LKALENTGMGNDFLNRVPITRMDKWDVIKLKCLFTAKAIIAKVKRGPTEWEKNLSSYSLYRGLTSSIYKELKKLNNQGTNKPINKQKLNRKFLKEEIQMFNKYMKICLTPLAIREIQIKITLRFHFLVSINKTNSKCRRCRAGGFMLLHCWWECKFVQPLWKPVWKFLKKNPNIELLNDPAILLLDIPWKYLHSHV